MGGRKQGIVVGIDSSTQGRAALALAEAANRAADVEVDVLVVVAATTATWAS